MPPNVINPRAVYPPHQMAKRPLLPSLPNNNRSHRLILGAILQFSLTPWIRPQTSMRCLPFLELMAPFNGTLLMASGTIGHHARPRKPHYNLPYNSPSEPLPPSQASALVQMQELCRLRAMDNVFLALFSVQSRRSKPDLTPPLHHKNCELWRFNSFATTRIRRSSMKSASPTLLLIIWKLLPPENILGPKCPTR